VSNGKHAPSVEVYRQKGLRVVNTLTKKIVKGQTSEKSDSFGILKLYDVYISGRQEGRFQVAYATWDDGDRDIRALEATGPKAITDLSRSRVCLSINTLGDDCAYSELRQARPTRSTEAKWAHVFHATAFGLHEGVRLDVPQILLHAGAIGVASKKKLLGVTDKTHERLCVIYPQDDELVPILAFVLTRVLPLLNGHPPREKMICNR